MSALIQRVVDAYWLRYSVPIRLSFAKNAATANDIIAGLDEKIITRSKKVTLSGRDHDKGNKMLTYKATSGGNTYTVRIQATPNPKKDHRHYWESDILVYCSCPAFRWQGVSYHADQDGYIWDPEIAKGRTFKPVIRDPTNIHFVCKHIYKALESSKRIYFDWEKPRI